MHLTNHSYQHRDYMSIATELFWTRKSSWRKGKHSTAIRFWRPPSKNLQQINNMWFPIDG